MLNLSKVLFNVFMDAEMKHLRRVPKFHLTKPPEVFKIENSAKRLIRVWYKNPFEDFQHVRQLSDCSRGWICHRKSTCSLVVLQETWSSTLLRSLELFSELHPNIAGIYDAYCYNEVYHVVSEYLELSLWELESKLYPLREWEIATIISEVG